LASCFDIFERKLSQYFWPPKSGKIETSGGCLLIIETIGDKYDYVAKEVKKIHTDKLPFIGYVEIKNVSQEYLS